MSTLKSIILSSFLLLSCFLLQAQDNGNIEFVENKGQWNDKVRYRGETDAGMVFLRNGGFTILQHDRSAFHYLQEKFKHPEQDIKSAPSNIPRNAAGDLILKSHSWNVDFAGSSDKMKIVPEKKIVTYNNYIKGNDPSKWATQCEIFQAITMKDVYPNIDVRYYTHNGTLKYDIIAWPGADVSKIVLRYEGVEKLAVKNKELVITTSLGEFKESKPYSYQTDLYGRKEVKSSYIVAGNEVRFSVEKYDVKAPLIIDPSLIFCSLSGSTANNWGFTATYGPDGSFYGGGIVFEANGSGFPVSPGAFQSVFQGGVDADDLDRCDIGIIRLTPNGGNRMYATYIGGGGNEQPHSLVADANGNLIIAGRTNSTSGPREYPTTGPTIGPGGAYDIVLTKLNATGTGLIGSRRIGGSQADGVNIKASRDGALSLQQNYGDDGRSEVILDGAGNIYLAGSTRSGDFPVFGGFQSSLGGAQDAVVIKMDPNLANVNPLFSTYLGGSADDAGYVLALGPGGDIYVAGGTSSANFPGVTGSVVGSSKPGAADDIDGYVTQITNDGSGIIRSTYIGTTSIDQVYGIQFDRKGFPYIMGQTRGLMAPINVPPGGFVQNAGKIFIGKLNPDLSGYVYRTTFGTGQGAPNISPTAFLVDRCENVYVSGWGGDIGRYSSAGTTGLIVTPDALQSVTDGFDFYFFVLRKDAAGPGPLYASFFGQAGGNTGDHVDGGTSRFDANGVIYQGVCANCGTGGFFPTTPGAWATTKPASAACNLGMIKIAFNLAGVGAVLRSEIGGVPNDTSGCVPLDVTFTDLVRNAREYIWDFGDGSPQVGPIPATSNGYTQTHTFTSVGTFRVMLIAIDPASCNERDTAYMNIRVGDNEARLNASVVKLDPCEDFNYRFTNLTPNVPGIPFTDTSFVWDFGDGSARVRAGLGSVTHRYAAAGTYNARLVLADTSYCNFPDSLNIQVRVSANVVASFTGPAEGCSPFDAVFTYTGNGGQTFAWNFGDPSSPDNTSDLANPTHMYANPGTYTVKLVVTDPNTCNISDSVTSVIVVSGAPTANFSFTPSAPVQNTPNVFTNLSSVDATRFIWDFGDGNRQETTSRSNITYQFNSTGTFNVCLIAFNDAGCSDTLCMPVSAIILPVLDVPNAFTPNSNDENSVIKVRGFGIAKMRFTIWNRWGQKVFETGNPAEGWDGKVKGVVQPMDVYAYTLQAEFFDGKKVTKKGDITLIR